LFLKVLFFFQPKIVPQLQGLALTVDFRQSAAAIGRIPTNYFRREMQQSEQVQHKQGSFKTTKWIKNL
jgi:hypothetical protein